MEKIKDYKKINLRDFRHKLTQLKDSLAAGEVYQVTEKGVPLAYVIPSKYKVSITKQKEEKKEEDLYDLLIKIKGKGQFKDEVKDETDYKVAYRKLLEKKYLKK